MSTIIPLTYITDRSRIVTREECERKRYLNYDLEVYGAPEGIQRRTHALPLLNGIEIHEAHAHVLAHAAGLPGGLDVDAAVELMRSRYAATVAERGVHGEADPAALVREQMAMLEALLRVFVLLWVPRILDEYKVLSIEKPMEWNLGPGLLQKLRFDVVLRRKGDNQLVILDYKSMARISDVWANKLEVSRQTSLYINAAQELFGEPVEIAYLGMVKGDWRKDTAKSSPFFGQMIQSTPLLYAYELKGEVGTVWSPEYTPKKGFVKIRTYESIEGGLKEWINYLWHDHRNLLNEMFIFNPPFSMTPQEMHKDRELIVREELEYIANVRKYHQMRNRAIDEGNDILFKQAQDFLDYVAAPQRKEACFKYGGNSRCQFYRGVCFNEGGLEQVMDSGEYEPREKHHSTEEEVAA